VLFVVLFIILLSPTTNTGVQKYISLKITYAAEEDILGTPPSSTKEAGYLDSPFSCKDLIRTPGQCLAKFFIHDIIFTFTAYLMAIAGLIFDMAISFSIDSNVLDNDFVRNGWTVTRDFANMLFIFVLLFISISTILQIEQYNAKNLLKNLIIIALIVNFSLFIARVVIDAGNITSLFFYNNIPAEEIGNSGSDDFVTELVHNARNSMGLNASLGTKSVSEEMVRAANPQRLFVANDIRSDLSGENDLGKLILVQLAGAILMAVTAWIFFTVAFIFIGRVVALWFLMALAPLAFAAYILPNTRSYLKKWWSELISKSFTIAVFLFFLWMIIEMARGPVFNGLNNVPIDSFFPFLVLLVLKFGILLTALFIAKDITLKFGGSIGGHAINIGKRLAAPLGMVAGGGVAAVMRRYPGKWAHQNLASMSDKERLNASKSKWGRFKLRAQQGIAESSFDVRGVGQSLAKTKLGKAAGADVLGSATGKGGFEATLKKQKQKYDGVTKTFEKAGLKGEALEEAKKGYAGELEFLSGGLVGTMTSLRGGTKMARAETAKKLTKDTGLAEKKRIQNTEQEEKLGHMDDKYHKDIVSTLRSELPQIATEIQEIPPELEARLKSSDASEAAAAKKDLGELRDQNDRKISGAGYGERYMEALNKERTQEKIDLDAARSSGYTEGVRKHSAQLSEVENRISGFKDRERLQEKVERRQNRDEDKSERKKRDDAGKKKKDESGGSGGGGEKKT